MTRTMKPVIPNTSSMAEMVMAIANRSGRTKVLPNRSLVTLFASGKTHTPAL